MKMANYTSEQIAEMRKTWDIPETFVPVASAPGVLAWATKSNLTDQEQIQLWSECRAHGGRMDFTEWQENNEFSGG